MTRKTVFAALLLALAAAGLNGCFTNSVFIKNDHDRASLRVLSPNLASRLKGLRLGGMFYETAKGRTYLPAALAMDEDARTTDGHTLRLATQQDDDNYDIKLTAQPATDIIRWGFAIDAQPDEYFTGIMERLVDGPQTETWRPDRKEALNLRGQKIQMTITPTLSAYAPFYLSSRGYAIFVRGAWPGAFDFCASDPAKVKVEFEGPALDFKIYTAPDPATLVQAHAKDAGLPVLPPKWVFSPWRWRDEHRNLPEYYDGSPVTGPYNSQVAEDILMMKAFGIPCGVYWIDRPWGPGRNGYDDFEIDQKRLPEFKTMVDWLLKDQIRTVLWIGPFTNGQMAQDTVAKKFGYPTQRPQANNYPLIDFTNPQAKAFWQAGVAKLLKLGVAGFKLDRAEEQMPNRGPEKVFDGRTLTENRNDYPVQYVKATAEIAKQYRGGDFVLMPRAAYTGSSPYAIFWGGDINSSQWGLRASIIAVQRAAVMGYPFWGSDTGGYNGALDRLVTARWLAFSCFTPLMEVGPTRNRAFWDMPTEPAYDSELIAIWRLYARLHERLLDYTYAAVQNAHETGQPVVRPLFMVYPKQAEAWQDWGAYLYGADLLVSPVWDKAEKKHSVYLPAGSRWRFAWNPGEALAGGQTVIVATALHQLPLFIRDGAQVAATVGDLNQEYAQSLAIAKKQPSIQTLDANLRAAFLKDHPQQ